MDKMTERYSQIKPFNSRWNDGWLISMTSMDGYEMVRYPHERPFVLTRAEWEALPELRRNLMIRPSDRAIRSFLYHVGLPVMAARYPGFAQTLAWLKQISGYTDDLAAREGDEDDDKRRNE